MVEQEELSMEEILASIRNVLWEKEIGKNAMESSSKNDAKNIDHDVFQLTKDMQVKKWNLPYDCMDWNFNDVAKKILHKYASFFAQEEMAEYKKAENQNL